MKHQDLYEQFLKETGYKPTGNKWAHAYVFGNWAHENDKTAKKEIDELNASLYGYCDLSLSKDGSFEATWSLDGFATKPSRVWYKVWTWWPKILSFSEGRLVLLWRGNPSKLTVYKGI